MMKPKIIWLIFEHGCMLVNAPVHNIDAGPDDESHARPYRRNANNLYLYYQILCAHKVSRP